MATQSTNKPKQATNKTKATNKPKAPVKGKEKDIKSQGTPKAKGEYENITEINLDTFDIEPIKDTKPVKSQRGGARLSNPIQAEPGEMSVKMAKLKAIYDLPKIDINSNDEVEERISDYFNYCIAQELRPTVEGLAMALGVDRRTLWDWETGRRRATVDSTTADIIKKAKDYIAFIMSDSVMEGKINPVTWIFYAKNYFGMKDQQDITITPNNQLQPTMSLEEITKRVQSDVVIDADDD